MNFVLSASSRRQTAIGQTKASESVPPPWGSFDAFRSVVCGIEFDQHATTQEADGQIEVVNEWLLPTAQVRRLPTST
jgi:hypothetical protein